MEGASLRRGSSLGRWWHCRVVLSISLQYNQRSKQHGVEKRYRLQSALGGPGAHTFQGLAAGQSSLEGLSTRIIEFCSRTRRACPCDKLPGAVRLIIIYSSQGS